ncbi:uncharacterized oxidoreductase [Halolactibacillus halophilus]|uniref:Glycerol dehydrogenase n=1 Tax=Halolactibacillus halophilus TaxID=306540 RepID=A0A1I5LYD1_9BACI|nr:iron-containing alcohol dehydrogenase family protein [Halolactibacillus halophilus]GEM00938.1 glycerol dehydrogenase [Halolactibacillus halophilus]SFP02240.1 uncharacterized oxidoreductase [Halolactibacillus halophilus]
MEAIKVQGTPNIYRHHDEALTDMKQVIETQGLKKGLLVTGTASFNVAEPFITPLNLNVVIERYNGECSREEVDRLKEKAEAEVVDYLLAVGGGKVIDVTKATAAAMGLPYFIVPTLASNCAAVTPLSVFYTEDGVFTDYVVFDQAAFMVAAEPGILIQTPTDYLRAGIGDTLAKWYEAKPLVASLTHQSIAVKVSQQAAKLCHDVLITHGEAALSDQKTKQITDQFIEVVDTILLASGMVGGFGEYYGRISGAHSIHNGLTVLAETHQYLHGDKVSYGILVQLSLFDEWAEINQLLPFYQALGLPTSFSDLGIQSNLEEKWQQVARHATCEAESIHLLGKVTPDLVHHAMSELEQHVLRLRKDDGE